MAMTPGAAFAAARSIEAMRPLAMPSGDDVAVRLVRDDVVPVVRVGRGAGGLERAVDAIDGLADDLELVDGVLRGGLVEFHGQPFASARTEASVRSTSGTLNALSCVVRAPARSAGRDGLRAARHLALGGLDAPRLVRHAAERDAAGAVALHDRGDRDQREGVRSAVADLAVDVRAADAAWAASPR